MIARAADLSAGPDRPAGSAWVAERFGVVLETAPDSPRPLAELVEVGLRHNPRRAHLLVSTVLGKHIPTDPRVVRAAGLELGELVAVVLAGARPVVLGFAETATALGHLVAEALDADYLHSTRRRVAGLVEAGGFEEAHSHATTHRLLPEDPALLTDGRPLVLVDDELSTGRTALNTIAALHAAAPRERYVVAALVDLRSPADRSALEQVAAELGVMIDVVALGSGSVRLPDGLAGAIAEWAQRSPVGAAPGHRWTEAAVHPVPVRWPARADGRHGFSPADVTAARHAAGGVAATLRPGLGRDVLVLGFEELMYAPLLIALALLAPDEPESEAPESDASGPDEWPARPRQVRFSTTTRSPVLAIDEPGYPIRTALRFPAHDDPDDGQGERFAYNVAPRAAHEPFTDVVLVIDDRGDTDALRVVDGLLAGLTAVTPRVHLVTLPTHRPVGPAPTADPT